MRHSMAAARLALALACCLMSGEVPPIGLGSAHVPAELITALGVAAAQPSSSLLVGGSIGCPSVFLGEPALGVTTVPRVVPTSEPPRWQPVTLSTSPGQHHTLADSDGRVLRSNGSQKTIVAVNKVLSRGKHEVVFKWHVDGSHGGGVGLVLEPMLSEEHFPRDGGWINDPPRGLWWLRNLGSGMAFCRASPGRYARVPSFTTPKRRRSS